MRVARFKKLCIAAIACIAIAVAAIAFIPKASPFQAEAQVIEVNAGVESKVALNSEIDVPTSITVEFQGEQTASSGVVVCPDGKIVSAGKIKVNQTGVYQLRYYFTLSGVTHTAIQNVEVYSDYFTLSNPSGGDITVSDEENELHCGKDGVIVNLKSGTSFVYNKVLDLRDCDEDGLSPIIELDTRYGHYDENGNYVQDVLEGWVRLTDCYNPNLYMELRMQNAALYNGCLYPGVKTNSQPVTGMDKGVTQVLGKSRIIKLDGFDYRVWQTDGSMNVGMYNMRQELTTGAVWKYDMQTKRVYLTYNNKENFLVSDLDEPLIYENGTYFPGFTTGEVFVTVYASGYNSAYAETQIISIGKDNMKQVASQQYVDKVAPAIQVDAVKTTQTGVYAAVGDTFTVPSAKAIDVNIVNGIDVAVYRNYGTDMQTNVSVVDGKFDLDYKDLYTIVYEAKDKAGNVGRETFTISTVDTQDHRAITLEPLQSTSLQAGARVDNLYEITNALNVEKENVKVKISVENEKQSFVGEGESFAFTPYYEGTYTIRYTYTDGVFAYEKTVQVQCERSGNVSFLEEASVPKYYLKGNFYAIDDIKAYTFANGYPEAVATEVYAVFDKGAEQKIDNPAKVEITGSSSVKFVYKAQNTPALESKEVKIITSVYNNGTKDLGYDMTKFFVGEFNASATNEDGKRIKNITYTSKTVSGNNTLSYFNPVSGRNFALETRIVKESANFDALRLILTDSKNANNVLFADLFNREDGTYISVNGGNESKLPSVEFAGTLLKYSYDYDSKFFRMGDYASIVDFDASTVYVDLQMRDIKGKSSIIVQSINEVSIAGNAYKDNSDPAIYVYDFQGDYSEGDVVKVSAPEFSDVISGVNYARAKLLISCSDGNPVYDSKGNVLTNLVCGGEYEIKLDRIATFFVLYEIFDFSGRSTTKMVTVNCADTTAPTIRLDNIEEGQTLVVKAYEDILIDFTVSDNITKAKDILVYIHLYCVDMYSFVPNVTNIKAEEVPENGVYKQKFSIPIKGNYQAQIHASDAEGNLCVKYIDIIVE